MVLLRGTVQEVKATKEKDGPLQKPQEAVRERELRGPGEEVKDSLQNETAALPGALKEAEAVEEKETLLREAGEEAA